jgi:hypothetical protein
MGHRILYIPKPVVLGEFIFTIDTEESGSAADTFVLPTTGSGYNATVYWGDGNSTSITGTPGNVTHIYDTAGIYQITVSGTFPRIYFMADDSDARKVLTIDQWGPGKWTSMEGAFYGCRWMEGNYTDYPDLSGVKSCAYMFYNCRRFDSSVSGFNTSGVTDFSHMFELCRIFSQSVNDFDTSSAEDMSFMFAECIFGFNSAISNLDTSKVTNMESMFYYCLEFNQPVTTLNTVKVKNMQNMFKTCDIFKQSIGSIRLDTATNIDGIISSIDINDTGNTDNYDDTLIKWAASDPPYGLSITDTSSKYSSAAASARNTLINTYGWTIDDGGLI